MIIRILLIVVGVMWKYGVFSQNITQIAVFEGETYNNTGIYGTTGTGVYRYSWYYEEWFQLYNEGLPIIDNNPKIDFIAVADTGSSYTSGIYIVADSAVFNYNWYYNDWFALPNNGLPRTDGKVRFTDISVRGKGSSTDQDIFVVVEGTVFLYYWYSDFWYPLTELTQNLQNKISKEKVFNCFPNPVSQNSVLNLELPEVFSGKAEIVIYNTVGKNMIVEKLNIEHKKNIGYKISNKLKTGIYFIEIKAGTNKYVNKLIIE